MFGHLAAESWHCCNSEGAVAYSDFHNRTACSKSLLIHPVKNKEAFWPLVKAPWYSAAQAVA